MIGIMSYVGPRPAVPGYADKLVGDDRDVLKFRPGITGPATLCNKQIYFRHFFAKLFRHFSCSFCDSFVLVYT